MRIIVRRMTGLLKRKREWWQLTHPLYQLSLPSLVALSYGLRQTLLVGCPICRSSAALSYIGISKHQISFSQCQFNSQTSAVRRKWLQRLVTLDYQRHYLVSRTFGASRERVAWHTSTLVGWPQRSYQAAPTLCSPMYILWELPCGKCGIDPYLSRR